MTSKLIEFTTNLFIRRQFNKLCVWTQDVAEFLVGEETLLNIDWGYISIFKNVWHLLS